MPDGAPLTANSTPASRSAPAPIHASDDPRGSWAKNIAANSSARASVSGERMSRASWLPGRIPFDASIRI